jgi:DNA-binding SARP family transcriptional activator/uncharacterized protein HemY
LRLRRLGATLVEFRVLGPVEVYAGGRRLDAGHARQRALLAVLLLELGHVVPADGLVDRVWGEEPPPSVRNALYGNVARLRGMITAAGEPGAVLARRAGGYVIEAAPGLVDVHAFRRLVRDAVASVDDERAAQLLRQAAGLWRGSALGGVTSAWLDGIRERLEEEHRTALGDLYDTELRLGRHAALVRELSAAAHAGDERLTAQLMLALYRSGQAAEALRRFERARQQLAEELGADPGPELRRLHEQVLRSDPALDWRAPASRGPVLARAGGPAVGATRVPHELPADVPAFTGRAAELAELDRLLAAPSGEGTAAVVISAVSGTGGVGKTALAVRWAHRAAHSFPDGQLYVNLRGYDPGPPVSAADALAGLLRSLGLAGEEIPPDDDSRAGRYRSLLSGRRMLVVLDNASDVEQVRPLLPGAPGCRVVVTSRDALAGLVARDGARRVELDVLPEDDAVGLLQAVIGARADQDLRAARRLAWRCARLPLALRVAAELAVAQPGLSLGQLAEELADEERRLELLDAGGDPRTAVRTVLSWSCRHLDDATVRGFALLGLHPGPDFELYAAAALAGVPLARARRLLETLNRAHLIQPSPAGPGRHMMHELLRAWARELAAGQGADQRRAALTRLLDHYLAAAAAATDILHPAERHERPGVPPPASAIPPVTSPGAARAWLDAQLACLTVAAAHAARHGWPGHTVRLSAVLLRYLDGGLHAEGVTIYGHAVSAARQLGDRAAEAHALINLGVVTLRQSRYEQAAGYFRAALDPARETGNRAAELRVLGNLGLVRMQQGSYDQAADYIEQAVAFLRQESDPVRLGVNLANLGTVRVRQGRYQEAVGCLQESRDIARDIGMRIGEAQALIQLGCAETALGYYQQAASHIRQSLALARSAGYTAQMADALASLGRLESLQGRRRQAARMLQRALALYRQHGDRSGQVEALIYLGQFHLADGRPGQARRHYAAALSLAVQIGDRLGLGRAHSGVGDSYDATGDREQARSHWQEALSVFCGMGVPEGAEVRARLDASEADRGQEPVAAPLG